MHAQTMREKIDTYVETHRRTLSLLTYIRVTILQIPTRAIEYFLATLAAITGFWIGWPWKHLYASDVAYYRVLVDYMPPWAWTGAFLLFAMPSAFFTGKAKWQLKLRLVGNMLLLSIWVLASLLFISDNAPYLATAWTPVFAFYQAWSLLALWLRMDEL